MYKLLIILFGILAFANISFAQDILPWDDEGIFDRAIISKSDIPYRNHPYKKRIGTDLEKELIDQYGVVPDIFVIDDYSEDIQMEWIFLLFLDVGTKYNNRANTNYHRKLHALKWGDIRQYFYWRFESLKTGKIIYSQISQGAPNYKLYKNYSGMYWPIHIDFDVNELPIPNDGSAYKLSIYASKDDPFLNNGIELSFMPPHRATIIARITNFTPLHGYVWAEIHDVFYDKPDKKLLLQLEKEFKYERNILKSLINIFHEEKNADSLRWAGKLYLQSINLEEEFKYKEKNLNVLINRFREENNEDLLLWTDQLYLNLMKENVFYLGGYKDICGNLYKKKEEEVVIGAFWAGSGGVKSEDPLDWLHRLLYEVSGDTTIFK